ncbi:hypothetical protein N665_0162s0057 [Sinapis alba]|nr:hypothetical protein N665_0162s0057 [Sinapis alba]
MPTSLSDLGSTLSFLPQTISPLTNKISLLLILILAVASLISVYRIVSHMNAPYLCKKDGIVLNCPHASKRITFSWTRTWYQQ